MKKTIEKILSIGGTVKFPYKLLPSDWMGDAYIRIINKETYVVLGDIQKQFSDSNQAINYYIENVFNSNNLGLVYDGIRRCGLGDLDSTTEKEELNLCKIYVDQFFQKDILERLND